MALADGFSRNAGVLPIPPICGFLMSIGAGMGVKRSGLSVKAGKQGRIPGFGFDLHPDYDGSLLFTVSGQIAELLSLPAGTTISPQ